jgi:hypothetical protein
MAAARAAKPGPLVSPGQVPLLYLDANVLLPEYLRAVILDLADAELVRVHWASRSWPRCGETCSSRNLA